MKQVVIYPGEEGYWIAECPSLPGCISQGETREEAIINIKEAITAYTEALEEDHVQEGDRQSKTSPLDVPSVRVDISTQELVAIVREGRERDISGWKISPARKNPA